MQAGKLDRLGELRHRVLTSNSTGEKVPSWPTAYDTVWFKKLDARGSKRFAASQMIAEQVTELQMRWRSDVLATDHIVLQDDGTVYEIQQIAEIGRRQGLDLLCRAIVV